MEKKRLKNERLSRSSKNAKDYQWYKDKADELDTSSTRNYNSNGISEYKRMKVNYDLFNNILNLSDFEYVCTPYGAEVGELPAKMVNRDISSPKIKAILGMEMKRPFAYKVVATNPEATSRKEQAEFGKLKEHVVSEIMTPIRQQIEMRHQQASKGRELKPEEIQEIKAKIEEEMKAMTPKEVKKYMEREHQDPAEIMTHQLLEYLMKKCNVKRKFNKAFKHGLLSAKQIMYVGVLNGEPQVWNVNSMRFNSDRSPDTEFVEDGEWATCEYPMTISEVIKYFGDELTIKEIDKLYENHYNHMDSVLQGNIFEFDDDVDEEYNGDAVRVLHCVWKSLRKIGFLTYTDMETGEQLMKQVDETYKIDEKYGDISIEWEWIPEVYETWKIGPDIYVNKRPVPGQFKDLDDLYHCKLPYYGVIYDNMNSEPTALMDRLKVYQYYYNIIYYRIELLLASDKGKKILMNINSIPDSAGMDIEKWQYFFESSPFMWYDPNEEGTQYNDVNTIAKQIDMSLASDIHKYMQMAEDVRQQAGRAVGISDTVEGQIGPNEAVSNTRQSLIQSSHVLEPYFELHNEFKKNVLQALIEAAKVAYSENDVMKLAYVLDDMSMKTLTVDVGMVQNSKLGLFVSNSTKSEETKEAIRQLAHAAMQNQKIELSDVIGVIKQDGVTEAEESLKVAEKERMERDQEAQQREQQHQKEMQEMAQQAAAEAREFEKEVIVLKEEERRKTEITKASLMAASFNPDQDVDNDGVNDFVELARNGLDADIKREKNNIERDKLEHQKVTDREKLKIEKMKAQNSNKK